MERVKQDRNELAENVLLTTKNGGRFWKALKTRLMIDLKQYTVNKSFQVGEKLGNGRKW